MIKIGNRARKLSLLFSLTTLILLAALAYWRLPELVSTATRLEEFRNIRVGEKVPRFFAVSETSGTPMGPMEAGGKFYVYYISDQLPPACLDLECDPAAEAVTSKGGHLLGFSDGKAAAQFGVKVLPQAAYALDTSVMAVTGKDSTILGIYEGAALDDLAKILKDLGL